MGRCNFSDCPDGAGGEGMISSVEWGLSCRDERRRDVIWVVVFVSVWRVLGVGWAR